MFITREVFKDLIKEAINCLKTPQFAKYKLANGNVLYSYNRDQMQYELIENGGTHNG